MAVSTILGNSAFASYHSKILKDNYLSNTSFSYSTKINFSFRNSRMRVKIRADSTSSNNKCSGFEDYRRSIWGDYFLNYSSDDQFLVTNEAMVTHKKLKEQVRIMLMDKSPKIKQKLEIVDAVQRLGVGYHFQTEIGEFLGRIMDKSSKFCVQDDDAEEEDDLYLISLKFRLLREHGYNISCDVFNKFKDWNNKFKDSTVKDVKGMLSLYEATHVRTHGEETLDEALSLTTAHLQSMATSLDFPLSDQINHALDQPCYLGIPRLEARKYFEIYRGNVSCNEILLSFAKLDFNLLQTQHQGEIRDLTRWWKELNLISKLPLARDRVVESYVWTLTIHFEPEYVHARRIITKMFAIFLIVDDMFDDFGTYQELELFAAAIDRWNLSEIDKLPDGMKEVYKAIMDLYSDIEEITVKQEQSYKSHYGKESIKQFMRANFIQSKWLHQTHIPTVQEYADVGIYASGFPMLTTNSLVGMNGVTKDTFDWLFSDPKLLTASSLMSRYIDDISDRQMTHNTDKVFSGVDCYMKQYGYTEQEAIDELEKEMKILWKDINSELLNTARLVPEVVRRVLLNTNRTAVAMYKDGGDYYTNVEGDVKKFVSDMLLHPVPL